MMKKICFVAFLLMMLQICLYSQDTVTFSHSGGFYDNSFNLELTCNKAHHIRYTTNGGTPTANSMLYEAPLFLDESLYSHSNIYTIQISPEDLIYVPESVNHCIVIRAAAFDDDGNCVSDVLTNSYFINTLGCDSHGLPVISICADSLDLFDYYTGIFVPGVYFDPQDPYWTGNYYQSGRDWEIMMNIEFYEIDNTGINQKAGLRTHGGNGRRFQQKGMKIYAREEYGKKRFKHKFFDNISLNDFKHLTIKPLRSSWNQAGIQDHVCNMIVSSGLDIEPLASRPIILFLNGEYWGIYFIHEKPDERYLENHLNADLESLNIMSNWEHLVDYGDGTQFINMMLWLETADLSNPDDYAIVDNFFDISSFIDYQIFELYSANLDWPSNNMCSWQQEGGKWRFFFKDGDACFIGINFDVFANATTDGQLATLLFRKLLANEGFVARFSERFVELMDTHLSYSKISHHLTEVKNDIQQEIPTQSQRFGYPQNYDTWMEDINYTDFFLRKRTQYLREMLNEFISYYEIDEHIVKIYPNITSGQINIIITGSLKRQSEISIYDMMGKIVFSKPLDNAYEGDVISFNPNLKPGIYLLKIGVFTQRIVIQ